MGLFKKKPKVPYRPCGNKYKTETMKNGSKVDLRCTRPKGHSGGHSNRRTS